MEIRAPNSDMIKEEGEGTGKRVKVKVVKNKVAIPYRTAEFDIMFGEGISRTGDVLDVATSSGIVTKRGTFFYYGEEKLGQGRENAKDCLKSNPEVMEQIAAALRTRAQSGALPVAASEPQPEEE